MILKLLFVAYLSMGLVLTVWNSRVYATNASTVNLRRFVILWLLWPPIVALATIEISRADKHR